MSIDGLKGLSWTTNDVVKSDGIVTAVLQATEKCRYAAIIRKPGKAGKVIAYLGR